MSTHETHQSVDRLLSLAGNEFIVACYRLLLHREPDGPGLTHFLARVSSGENKLTIAADLASSDEAMALPASRKLLISAVLSRHACAVFSRALTPSRRANAVRRTERYFEVLLGRDAVLRAASGTRRRSTGDPFESYLASVINAKDR